MIRTQVNPGQAERRIFTFSSEADAWDEAEELLAISSVGREGSVDIVIGDCAVEMTAKQLRGMVDWLSYHLKCVGIKDGSVPVPTQRPMSEKALKAQRETVTG